MGNKLAFSGPYLYHLQFDAASILKKDRWDADTKRWLPDMAFSTPVTDKGSPKIYVFCEKKDPFYFGTTIQSVSSRFRQGFSASKSRKSNGYSGYPFKNHLREAIVLIWVQNGAVITNHHPRQRDVETIEAELVHRFRKEYKQWPKYQTEIHFWPFDDEHSEWVERIWERLKGLPEL